MMSNYPKWRYSEDRQSQIVESEEQEATLGGKWFDTPREAGWLGEAERNKPKPQAPKSDSEQVKELKEQNQFLFDENKRLQAALDESDTYINTLQKALEEAQKNDQRGDDGKFKAADPAPAAPAGDEPKEDEGEANPDEAPVDPAPAPADEPAGDEPAGEEAPAEEEAAAPKSKKKK